MELIKQQLRDVIGSATIHPKSASEIHIIGLSSNSDSEIGGKLKKANIDYTIDAASDQIFPKTIIVDISQPDFGSKLKQAAQAAKIVAADQLDGLPDQFYSRVR